MLINMAIKYVDSHFTHAVDTIVSGTGTCRELVGHHYPVFDIYFVQSITYYLSWVWGFGCLLFVAYRYGSTRLLDGNLKGEPLWINSLRRWK